MISRKAFFYRAGISVLIMLVAFVVLDYPWISVQISAFLHPPENTPIVISAAAKQEPNYLTIPSLNIRVPIQYITEKNETAYQAALINGVVHYPDTAFPGRKGNVYIFGHSSDYIFSKGKYKTVFALLPRMKAGDLITVTDADGISYDYIVDHGYVTSAKDVSALSQPAEDAILTLQTSYPVGTALKRYLVVAKFKNKSEISH